MVAGLIIWTAVLGLWAAGALHLSIFQLFLLLGPTVVVPLGRPLIASDGRARRWWAEVAALLIVGALLVPPGPLSTALAVPWLVTAVSMTVGDTMTWWRGDPPAPVDRQVGVLGAIASAWLVVGAISLVASRSGTQPFGVSPELVQLGAVHFSYAGFAATVLVRGVLHCSPHRGTAQAAAVATVGGAAIVALGHLTIRPFELAGAVSMTIGVLLIGLLSWSIAPPRSWARVLLRVGAIGVIVPMAFALQYAWALTTGGSHLPYDTIARIHGSLNAIAFSTGGLLAWRLLTEAGNDGSIPPPTTTATVGHPRPNPARSAVRDRSEPGAGASRRRVGAG